MSQTEGPPIFCSCLYRLNIQNWSGSHSTMIHTTFTLLNVQYKSQYVYASGQQKLQSLCKPVFYAIHNQCLLLYFH